MLRSFPELWLLAVSALAVLTIGACPDKWTSASADLRLVHHLSRELPKGHLTGEFTGHRLPLTDSQLEPGDIIACHNPNGAYGYWTHAVVYVGQGEVVDSDDFVRGTVCRPLHAYQTYQEVMVLRANASKQVRRTVARNALAEVGKPYDPFSPSTDKRSEYCSKLVWKTFRQAGVTLCPVHRWIVPDDLVYSPHVTKIAQWSDSHA